MNKIRDFPSPSEERFGRVMSGRAQEQFWWIILTDVVNDIGTGLDLPGLTVVVQVGNKRGRELLLK